MATTSLKAFSGFLAFVVEPPALKQHLVELRLGEIVQHVHIGTAIGEVSLFNLPDPIQKLGQLVGGHGEDREIQGRMEQIKVEIDKSTSDYDREKLQERLAKLVGGVAIIRVGAATETELKEKKHRVEDALSATRAAVEEGIVPGGGVALINAVAVLDDVKMEYPDEQTGVNILRAALQMPLRTIAVNAGKEGAVILDTVRRIQKEKNNNRIGYDVLQGEFVDMVEAGIIDPAKVTKGALSNAASIAAMILSTEALITDIPEPKRSAPPAMPEY